MQGHVAAGRRRLLRVLLVRVDRVPASAGRSPGLLRERRSGRWRRESGQIAARVAIAFNIANPCSPLQTYTRIMMRRVRATLSWLLLFALPIHGIAGTAMAKCDSMAMPALSASSMSTSSHADGADGLGMHDSKVAGARSPCGGGGDGEQHSSGRAAPDCAGSGACGIMPMPAPAVATFLHLTVLTIALVTPSSPPIGFLTGAPDRPPRALA